MPSIEFSIPVTKDDLLNGKRDGKKRRIHLKLKDDDGVEIEFRIQGPPESVNAKLTGFGITLDTEFKVGMATDSTTLTQALIGAATPAPQASPAPTSGSTPVAAPSLGDIGKDVEALSK